MLLDPERSQLLVVDVQERLMPAMHEPERTIAGACRLLRAAAELAVPATVSEQYPKGLGPTLPAVADLAPAGSTLAKTHFSCAADPQILARLAACNRPQVVIAGVEAHVCVLQTAIGLAGMGYRPYVVWDAVTSRAPADKAVAERRLAHAGVDLVTGEMVLFEWLGRAGTPAFKALSPLLR